MGLLILIIAGAALGWLATIVTRIEDGSGIARSIMAGTLGSLIVGIALTGANLLGGVRATTLLWAMLGAVVLIALYHVLRQRSSGQNI